MNELLAQWTYFGMALGLSCYFFAMWLQKKCSLPILNPLLISTILIISFLHVFHVDYETFDKGAQYITYFLTPATVCLAVPLYKQFQILKNNAAAILAGVLAGCLAHGIVIGGMAVLCKMEPVFMVSLLPKSITTAIALGTCEELGGISGITIAGTLVAGLMGAIFGPVLLKWFRIKEPVAQGVCIGTASHAIGTSKMIELGEVQGAMSSLAIVVSGLITVVAAPVFAAIFS
ncbi:MAG: LrgB family protein [Roseburia sp.]|nr:LrgB family protein [Roseburia sp.]MCM1277499.1 LrgB family protein [Robinsoniella sp.]